MKCSDVIVITRRHVGGILTVNKNIAKMRKSENSYANVIADRVFFDLGIIPHATVSKQIYDVTLLQVYLQHDGNNCC